MPSFEYFATFEESVGILRDLCEEGFRIVAEPGHFDTPKAPIFDSVTGELVDLLEKAPGFYLAGSFTRFPVQFSHLTSGPSSGKYAINLMAQGPLMQSMIGRVKSVDGRPTLLAGDTSYQEAYRNPETNEWEKASPELKAAYRKAVSIIKKRCVRYKGRAEIFICPMALKLFEKGEVQINAPLALQPSRP
jgi:hypothetical protein